MLTCNFEKKVTGMSDYLITDISQIIHDCNLKKDIIDKLVYHIIGKLIIMFSCNIEKKITGNQDYLIIDKYETILCNKLKNEIIDKKINPITGFSIN